jgi:hypothetical protein
MRGPGTRHVLVGARRASGGGTVEQAPRRRLLKHGGRGGLGETGERAQVLRLFVLGVRPGSRKPDARACLISTPCWPTIVPEVEGVFLRARESGLGGLIIRDCRGTPGTSDICVSHPLP